jgi:hypothetical protein
VKAAAGDQCDLDPARMRVDDRIAMRVGQPAPAVQKRSINIDRNQTP